MNGTATTFSTALEHARAAIDEALDALNTIDRPDSDYVLPLLAAQKDLALAIRGHKGVDSTIVERIIVPAEDALLDEDDDDA